MRREIEHVRLNARCPRYVVVKDHVLPKWSCCYLGRKSNSPSEKEHTVLEYSNAASLSHLVSSTLVNT
jgi:hypothetical protein